MKTLRGIIHVRNNISRNPNDKSNLFDKTFKMTIAKIQVMKIHTSVNLIKIFCTSNTFILSLSKISIEISHVNGSKSHRFKSLDIVFILNMFRENLVFTIVQ